jgi:hypothetical protein
MDSIMRQAIRWCKKNNPQLADWMTINRFEMLMSGTAAVVWGDSNDMQTKWVTQVAFLKSMTGIEYLQKLDTTLKSYLSSL